MSFKKHFLLIFLFSLFFQQIFATTGTSLCNNVFEYLDKKGLHPQVQSLVSNGTNSLPYNIIVNFHSEDTKSPDNLILFYEIQDFEDRLEGIEKVLEPLKSKEYNSTVVFSYGNKINIPRDNIIYGADIFAQSLDSTQNNSAYLFCLNAPKNTIITGNSNSHSPSWMLKDLFDAYSDAKMTEGLPLYFISQAQDYNYITDKSFLAFIQAEIPCIQALMRDNEKVNEVITHCIQAYDKSRQEISDSHTFMFRFFGKRIWFSETRIIKSMIIILILSLILVFYVGFINKNLRKEFWNEIRNNWYVLPVIYTLSLLGFFAGKGLYSLLVRPESTNYTAFGFIILQISISMLFVSLFYMINLSLLKKYTTRSLDYILVVLTFINQFVFSMADISLFPIFMLIFIIAVISLIFRRNWIHIILFVFLIIPFIPYVNAVYRNSSSQELHELLLHAKGCPFLISLVVLPLYLMWLRILNAIKKRYTKKRIYALIISATYFLIFLSLIIVNKIFYSKNTKTNITSTPLTITEISVPQTNSDYDFTFSYSDKKVFSDTIRTVKLSSKQNPVYVSLKILSDSIEQELPVLYSENDFIKNSDNSISFSLPLYPPKNLEFNYGSQEKTQTLSAEQIFYDEQTQTYYSVSKIIQTEGKL